MIHLHQLADTRFILLTSEEVVGVAQTAVRTLDPLAVIVRQRVDDTIQYHLFMARTVLAWSEEADTPLANWLSADSQTPTRSIYSSAETAPDECVVVNGEQVVGFYNMAIDTFSHKSQWQAQLDTDTAHPFSVMAECPEQIPLGQTVSVIIDLTREMGGGASLPIAAPLGTTIDVVMQAQQGLDLVQRREGQLVLMDNERSQPLNFKVKATDLGEGRLRLLCFQNGLSLGELYVTPQIVPVDEAQEHETMRSERPLAITVMPQPDLTLIIEQFHPTEPHYLFRLTARELEHELYFKSFGPLRLKQPQAYFQEFFGKINQMSLADPATREHIARKGADLYTKVLPAELQPLLWELRGQIKTIQIMSEEAWIPWELLRLQGWENGRLVEGAFLCEAFEMTRWFLGTPRRPKIRLKQLAVINPTDSGLRYAPDEWDYLYTLNGQNRTIKDVPASYMILLSALKRGEYDAWHFTGHGRFNSVDPDLSGLSLEDGKRLQVEDISGSVGNCGLKRPLIFFNACQTGQGGMSLTGVGGWAKRFVSVGASAFIGSLWNIGDKAAYTFTRAFYDHLLSDANPTIGAAVKQARAVCQKTDTLSWLAYTVFADPLAKVMDHIPD